MTKDAPKRAKGKGDARAILAAWEWAAEIRRRLDVSAVVSSGAEWDRDEHERQIESFDALVRRGDPWKAIDAFSAPNIETERTREGVEALRSSCLAAPWWTPRDHRSRTSRDIPPNAKAALAEAARMAIYLIPLHHSLPLTPYPVETLEEPTPDEKAELLNEVWELALERIPHAVAMCAPDASPPEDWKARIVAELDGEEVRAALDWWAKAPGAKDPNAKAKRRARGRGPCEADTDEETGRGRRGGPEHAAYVLIEELTGASVNTVRREFLRTQPSEREKRKREPDRQKRKRKRGESEREKRKREFQEDQEAWRTRQIAPLTGAERAERQNALTKRRRDILEQAMAAFPRPKIRIR